MKAEEELQKGLGNCKKEKRREEKTLTHINLRAGRGDA